MTSSPFLSFCNELLAFEGLSLAEQASICASLGYRGLEIAPETLGEAPHTIPAAEAAKLRAAVENEGMRVTGLHWLLRPYPELCITSLFQTVQTSTQDTLLGLLDLCAELGGTVMVHGSPGQRRRDPNETPANTLARVADFFRPVAEAAGERGITYCIEPLSRHETNFINTVDEAEELLRLVDHPAFLTMIDTSAAGLTEDRPVADLIRDKLPGGRIGHIQLNDTNRGAPGTGDDPFEEILTAIRECGWDKPLAVEPFVVSGDARITAACAATTVKSLWEAAR
ncbi:sugar phosphate isomerase/epimerase [uncultured Roseibium sp.]|uniref:sugar phosphate isomerase/epimerase family protein n=1 Tax=uncultured Roseibium sp. TaxID=1936171 RepID=UPI002632D841|nr:sugar phosphate isomerase/epimerase family protein [uncultured Roseibium sp.]